MRFNYAELPLNIVALSVDRTDELAEHFEANRRPDFHVGWVGPNTMAEVAVTELPSIYVLDSDLSVVFFTDDPDRDYQALRELLDGMAGE